MAARHSLFESSEYRGERMSVGIGVRLRLFDRGPRSSDCSVTSVADRCSPGATTRGPVRTSLPERAVPGTLGAQAHDTDQGTRRKVHGRKTEVLRSAVTI